MKRLAPELNTTARKQSARLSPLLAFLAGEHASGLAALWNAPHEGFFVLPTARRHAAAMLASGLGQRHALGTDGLVRLIERQKDRVIAETLVGPAHSAGFMKALAKLGEQLWTEQDYLRFLTLFCEPESNLYIRHLDIIRPHMLEVIGILPAPLRQTRILSFIRHAAAARDVALAYGLIARIRDCEAQAVAAERWCRAASRERLFEMVKEDLCSDRPVRWTPPPLLPAPFERIETVRDLKSLALEFRNCLEDFVENFTAGRMAIYVWNGQPKAAVALTWNIDGWRLAEAEAEANTELEEAPLREIAESVATKDVRVGSSIYNMRFRLAGFGREGDADIEAQQRANVSFRDLCDLGDLWN